MKTGKTLKLLHKTTDHLTFITQSDWHLIPSSKEIRTLSEINKLSGDSLSFYFKWNAQESVPPYFGICGPVAYSLSLVSGSPSTQFIYLFIYFHLFLLVGG